MELSGFGTVMKGKGGKWIDRDGNKVHGIYHRMLQKSEHTIVYTNGIMQRRYVYPRILRSFYSPLVNDYNLNFVGGWGGWFESAKAEAIELINRVINGLKPAGFGAGTRDLLAHLEKLAKQSGLATNLTLNDFQPSWGELWHLGAARKDKFGEAFDLPAVERDYARWGIYYPITERFSKIKFSDLLVDYTKVGKPDIDYASENKPFYLSMLTGLLLGYPLETTASFILH